MGEVAFTVDVERDVPTTSTTWRGVTRGLPRLLDLLSKHDVPATFFVTGRAAEAFPESIEEISRDHEVGCHGYEHERFDAMEKEEQSRRIGHATKVLREVTGREVCGFRAPSFSPATSTFEVLRDMRYLYDASNTKYTEGPDPTPYGLVEIPNNLPSSFLRLPTMLSTPTLSFYLMAAGLMVLDYHTWELVRIEDAKFDCRFATGDVAYRRLDKVLGYLSSRVRFRCMKEIALSRREPARQPDRGSG
jgi:peptidoglycan/xylan/chitin deacetylase (PgdA/CDA1 family)